MCMYVHFNTRPLAQYKHTSHQYGEFHCGNKTAIRSAYLHNGISYTSKVASSYSTSPRLLNYFLHFRLWKGIASLPLTKNPDLGPFSHAAELLKINPGFIHPSIPVYHISRRRAWYRKLRDQCPITWVRVGYDCGKPSSKGMCLLFTEQEVQGQNGPTFMVLHRPLMHPI